MGPPHHTLALSFYCPLPSPPPAPKPNIKEWSSRVLLLPASSPPHVRIILTYHWSLRAACPFSSSSSSPRQTDKTQGITSSNRWEDGCRVPLERRQEEGSRLLVPLHPHQLHPPPLFTPFNPNAQTNYVPASKDTCPEEKRRD